MYKSPRRVHHATSYMRLGMRLGVHTITHAWMQYQIYTAMFASVTPQYFIMGLRIHDTIVLVNKQDINDWTHFSLWRLWFTCKAPANLCTPSALISFLLRLQNVREQKRERYMYAVQETFMNKQQQYTAEMIHHRGEAWVNSKLLIHQGTTLQSQCTPPSK